MSLVQKDYILRLIESIAAAVARVLKRKEAGDLVGARRELDMAIGELLGPSARLAPMMDSRTASQLVGDPRRVAAWATLLREDADLLRLMSRDADAAATEQRALELLLEVWLPDHELAPDALAALEDLRTRVDAQLLDSRYREALGSAVTSRA
ncbi:MAG: hypothetical protein ABI877_16525 [Gemmatimonadaceae bacterium]